MASWQSRIVNLLLRVSVKRRLARISRVDKETALASRRNLESLQSFVPRPPAGTKVVPVDEDGVRGQWVAAPSVLSAARFWVSSGKAKPLKKA